jgi:hypothetical protein
MKNKSKIYETMHLSGYMNDDNQIISSYELIPGDE